MPQYKASLNNLIFKTNHLLNNTINNNSKRREIIIKTLYLMNGEDIKKKEPIFNGYICVKNYI